MNHMKNDFHRPLRKVVAGDNLSNPQLVETVACVNHAFFFAAATFRKTVECAVSCESRL